MELDFQQRPLEYLRCIFSEMTVQEETAETIVPDSYPDVASIADCCAAAILRGKDCRDGSVTVAGGVKGTIIYTPEDRTYPRKLDVYLPFSVKFENKDLRETSQVAVSVRVRSVDGRMVNSRKVLIRVDLSCQITAYEQTTEMLCTLENRPQSLQLKCASYQVFLPLEYGERSFVITDELALTQPYPPVTEMYQVSCIPELTERKLVGNKAVFKGILHCKCLYRSENERLYTYSQQLPFSQYCEMERDYDEETAAVALSVTGYDLEDRLLNVHILAQCLIQGTKTLEVVEDAYCTQGILNAQWKSYQINCCLDRQTAAENLRQRVSGSWQELLDTNVYWDHPVIRRTGDRIQIAAPVSVHVLGYDDMGDLHGAAAKGEVLHDMILAAGAKCQAQIDPSGEVYTALAPDGAEVRSAVTMGIFCDGGEPLRTLCGASLEPGDTQENRPSVIIRTVPAETVLWEIAKAVGSTVDGIQAANGLEQEILDREAVLLLPIG